jgi:hypothetical protein
MKKTSFFIFLSFCICQFLTAQTTYYWVGGNGNNGVTSFTSNSNWNTSLDGSGTSRVAEDSTEEEAAAESVRQHVSREGVGGAQGID